MSKYFNFVSQQNSLQLSLEVILEEVAWEKYIEDIKEIGLAISVYIFNKLELENYASKIEYSINLTNDLKIKKLNHQFRGINKATNVLSFPIEEIEENNLNQLPVHNNLLVLGDIIFSYETIAKESQEKNISFKNHFAHLLVHGILHCLGYDHEEENEAQRMENLETLILLHFNIDSPYDKTNN